jgi:hypothetical protein
MMRAYHDRHPGPLHPLPLLLFTLAALGLLGIVLWRLWTEVLGRLWQ